MGVVIASPWFNTRNGDLTAATARIGGLGTGTALVGFAVQMVLNTWCPDAR